jgi:WD40 repeat protein
MLKARFFTNLMVCGILVAQTPKTELPSSPVTVRLNLQTGQSGILTSVAVSEDGKHAVVSSMSGTVTLWDLETKRQVRRLKGTQGPVWTVRLDLTGTRAVGIVLEPEGRNVYVWDVTTGKAPMKLPGGNEITAFAFGCGNSPMWAAEGGVIWRTDQSTGVERRFPGEGKVTSLAESRDCKQIVSGLDDGAVVLWPNEWNAKPQLVRAADNDRVSAVAFSPTGEFFAAGSESGRVWLFQRDGSLVATFLTDSVKGLEFSSGGEFLLAAPEFRKTQIWDVQTRHLVGEIGSQFATGLAVNGDRAYICSGEVEIWSISQRKLLDTLRGGSESISAVAFSPQLRSLASVTDSGDIAIWDLTTGHPSTAFKASTKKDDRIDAIGFAKDSKSVLADFGSQMSQYSFEGVRLGQWPAGKDNSLISVPAVETPDRQAVLASPGGLMASFLGAAPLLPAEIGAKLDAENPKAARWQSLTGQPFPGTWARMQLLNEVKESLPFSSSSLGGDSRAVFLDRASGRPYFLQGHGGDILSTAVSPDGRLGLTGSKDGSVKLWRLRPCCEDLATLMSSKDGSWTVVSPQGWFDTNNFGSAAGISWVSSDNPLRALPLEIFMRDYYTPRLLPRLLTGENLPKLPAIEEIRNRIQPEVQITDVKLQPDGRVTVTIHAASITEKGQPSGLQDLRVFRDGQLVAWKDGSFQTGYIPFRDIQVPAAASKVAFTAYAFNDARIKSNTTPPREFQYRPSTSRSRPRAYLLQIGVNHYNSEGCDLHFAVNDARKLRESLATRLKKRGLDVVATELASTDDSLGATKKSIREALESIAKTVHPDDSLFLSFAGHGYTDASGRFYIFPSDIHGSCERPDSQLTATAISADELAEWLRPIDAGELTFILDACYSAKSVEANDFKPGPMGSPGLGQLAYDKRMRILTASQSDQTAQEYANLGNGNGLLTYVLTEEGLLKGEADWKPIDRKVTIAEWLAFAADRVPKWMEPKMAQQESTDASRGVETHPIGARAAQIPALFDFTKKDQFVIATTTAK